MFFDGVVWLCGKRLLRHHCAAPLRVNALVSFMGLNWDAGRGDTILKHRNTSFLFSFLVQKQGEFVHEHV